MPKCIIEDTSIKKVYFVGVKGVGMTSLAIIAKEAGFMVAGSDIEEEFLTDEILQKNNIPFASRFSEEALREFTGNSPKEVLVVTTAAHDGLDNRQCILAKKMGIQVVTHGQAVGLFMEGKLFKRKFQGISVLGCHGKTTVTAMVATALSGAGLDPSYAVGTSELFPLGNPGHLGKGEYFIAEADEFISDMNHDRTVKFLYQYPKIAIINNIDFDHPDVYAHLEDVYQVFLKFAKENVLENGMLVINGDDSETRRLKDEVSKIRKDLKIITFGESSNCDVRLSNFKERGWGSEFDLEMYQKNMGPQKISVPGLHNAKNMLGVIALLSVVKEGIEWGSIISKFHGSKRRQEKIGETGNGALIVDDYAHHPDEIKKTIDAIRNAYPEKKVIAIFQPHTVGRTKSLVNEFANAFSYSNYALFLPVFSSKREGDINYLQIYFQIEAQMRENGTNVTFFKDERDASESGFSPYFLKKYRSNVVKYVLDKFDSPEFAILTLGAGDVYKIAYDLVSIR